MALTQDVLQARSVEIATDLTGKETFLATMGAVAGQVALAAATTAPLFPLTVAGNGLTTPVSGAIAVHGYALVTLGATVAIGDKLTSDATGAAIATVTAGNYVVGIAQEAGVIGDQIIVLLTPALQV